MLCATVGVLLGWVLFDSSFKNTVDNKKERTNYKLNLVAANLGRKEKPLLIGEMKGLETGLQTCKEFEELTMTSCVDLILTMISEHAMHPFAIVGE